MKITPLDDRVKDPELLARTNALLRQSGLPLREEALRLAAVAASAVKRPGRSSKAKSGPRLIMKWQPSLRLANPARAALRAKQIEAARQRRNYAKLGAVL